jgi:hypothetical protein
MIEVRPVFFVVICDFGRLKLDDNSLMRDTRNRPLSLILHSSESSFVYRKIKTQMHTREYAINVPIDIMFINCCRSKILDKIAANAPHMSVPQNGVFVLESTLEKISNNNPSDAMEYNILGNGNSVPIMFVNRANTAPIVTIHSRACHPNCW